MVRALDVKLMRDFRRLWAQGLAIALVVAVGVMTLVLGVGAYTALSETRDIYYERYWFADLFAVMTRAPASVLEPISAIPGIAVAEGRISGQAVFDIEGLDEPAGGQIISIPNIGESALNRLFMVEGRLPDLNRGPEVVVSEPFATANGFALGHKLPATIGGNRLELTITGIALSPEFIYTAPAGSILPDDQRFGIVWMRYSDAAASLDMSGAFNSVTAKLNKGADQAEIIDRFDAILEPFGGTGAIGRDLQMSHAFLDSEIVGLEVSNYFMAPIFLGIASFLVNMTLARLIALEREQIGLLKALGYSGGTIAWHYMKLALLVAALGTIIGWLFGAYTSRGMAELYAEFYKFPFLHFRDRPEVFAISGAAAMVAAALGGLQTVRATMRLSPAVAMAPPSPPRYKRFLLDRFGITRIMPQGLTMALRNIARTKVRAGLTILGVSLSAALVVTGLFSGDSVDLLIDVTFFKADRQQASLVFAGPVAASGVESARRLPGVIAVEPSRAVAVVFRNGARSKNSALIGKPLVTDLSRIIDAGLDPIPMPEYGLALSKMLADLLDLRVGDIVQVKIREGDRRTLDLPVSQINQQFMGLGGYMEIGALNRALGEGEMANGADLMFDTDQTRALYDAVKVTPAIAGLSLQRKLLESFRATIGENLGIMRFIYVSIGAIIVFGVVYNTMRIQLSERARELASFRVLGFTKGEVSSILFVELGLLIVVAIPLGWVMGYGLAAGMAMGMATELFRFPLVISQATYVSAGLTVLAAALFSAFVVKRRVDQLDMIEVLKTRE